MLPSLICAVHPNGTGIMWIGMSGRKANRGALHCYCDGVGPKHIWQPWWCNGFVEDTDLFLHLGRCPVCGLTQVWKNWPDRPFDECWTLDETDYEPEGIFIEPEEPRGKDDE